MRTRLVTIMPSLAVSLALAFVVAPSAAAHRLRPGGFPAARNSASSGIVLQWYDITNSTINAAAFPQPVTQSNAWDISWLAASHAVDRSRDPS